MFQPSVYQQDIFEFIRTGKGSAIVEAVAGSGKTTTIIQSMKLIDARKVVLFLAFNKSIAEELKKKTPYHVDVMTLNALGHRAWCRKIKAETGGRVALNANKTRDLINTDHFRSLFDRNIIRENYGNVLKLVSLGKFNGLVPRELSHLNGIMEANTENWHKLIDHHSIEFESEMHQAHSISMANNLLAQSIAFKDQIDFNDQLYMTTIFDAPMRKYDFVFIDEAQDVTEINRQMAKMSLARDGRLIAVGDPAQAIYGFRGADSNALNNIAKDFNCTKLPLSISYRCPKRVVKEAQKIVSNIQPHEDAQDGSVTSVGCYVGQKLFKPGDMVLCRCVAPLIKLAYYLVSRKQPVIIFGSDIAKQFIDLIDRFEVNSIYELQVSLSQWANREIEKATRKDPNADISRITDKKEAIMTFIDCTTVETVAGLIVEIQNLFGNAQQNSVMLSTIHKAKGLEADKVFILDYSIMPIRYAKQEWQLQQERNLQYVAITRSKQDLVFVESPKKESF